LQKAVLGHRLSKFVDLSPEHRDLPLVVGASFAFGDVSMCFNCIYSLALKYHAANIEVVTKA
jgi:hypothetical protein